MIVVLKKGIEESVVNTIAQRVEDMGLKAHVIVGTERTVIAAVGDKRNGEQETLESYPEVEKVVPILAPYKIASLETRQEHTVVETGSLKMGNGHVGVIAGPCSVETEEQILESAVRVKEAGATALRGGAFKPRTSPYSFQGLKEVGLQYLAAARDATGLAIVTEVMTPEHVDLVARYSDVMQIGARNMQNYHLLQAVGEVDKPVLLKRGPAATIDEFLLAAEYILDRGNPNVILCERGIRTFEAHTRFTLPLATVPYLKERTHLPVVIDPSHGTGIASLVKPMSRAAVAAGADGLIIEVHPNPKEAASDAAQTISCEAFAELMVECRKVAEALGYQMGDFVATSSTGSREDCNRVVAEEIN
ncbi:MAG: 3-deoxy-7-phosphoheptulonate synthase [Planctomyces sp.]|nr:3-deoxy-7-phosphoheptulonate synthase [Planctomyces sp.]